MHVRNRLGGTLPVWAVVVVSLAVAGGAEAAPLASLDFGTGAASHLRVVGKTFPVVTVDGQRLLDLSAGRETLPMEWPANMPNPGFPGKAGGAPAAAEPLRLVLNVDQEALGLHGPQDLVFLITVYDLAEGNVGSDTTEVRWATEEKAGGSGRFTVSGSPYATETVARPRLITKTVPAFGVLLNDSRGGGDVELSPGSRLYVQRIEVYKLPPSPLDPRESRRVDGMISYPKYRQPASGLDVWQRDLSDLIVLQAQAYATWADAKEALQARRRHLEWRGASGEELRRVERDLHAGAAQASETTVAMDAFYYEGQVALVRGEAVGYQRLLVAARSALSALRGRALELLRSAESFRPTEPIPATADRPSPLDRVLFTTFANSPWDYWDPYNATGRYLPVLGVHSKMLLSGAPALEANGTVNAASREAFLTNLARERAKGFDLLVGVGHHGFHLTEHGGLPDWLQKQVAPESVYDVTYAGKALTSMDLFNPRVREYFLKTVTNLARETARNPHLLPWYYWGEPACASGYSPAARRAFGEYLRGKYGEIGKLNAAWGSNYGAFTEIQPPPPPGVELRKQASGLTYEFETFRRESFVQWWRDTAAALRKGDPRARLWFEGWGRYDYLLNHGMDQLGSFDASDLASVHVGGATDTMRVWGSSLAAYSGTPLADGETLACGDYYQGFANLPQLQAAAEEHLLASTWYGARLFQFWTNTLAMSQVYSYGGPRLYDGSYLAPLSPVAGALRTVRRKSDLFDPIVKSTRIVPSAVGVLYSSTSFINSWPYNEVEHEMGPIHGWLFQSDWGYRYAHEEAIADGREDLQSFRVLVAPWAMWLQPQAAQALLAWVRAGGVLISSGPVGAYDQYGKPLGTILDAALGKDPIGLRGRRAARRHQLSAESQAYLRGWGTRTPAISGGGRGA